MWNIFGGAVTNFNWIAIKYVMEFSTSREIPFLLSLWSSTIPRLQNHNEETFYFLPLSPKEFLVLIWSSSEGWKPESTLKPLSGFEPGTPGLTTRPLTILERLL